jgi:hypothetical protein
MNERIGRCGAGETSRRDWLRMAAVGAASVGAVPVAQGGEPAADKEEDRRRGGNVSAYATTVCAMEPVPFFGCQANFRTCPLTAMVRCKWLL